MYQFLSNAITEITESKTNFKKILLISSFKTKETIIAQP